MKKIIYLILIITFSQACSKSKNSGPASIKYKIDGEQVQINGGLDSTKQNPNTGYYYGCYVTKFNGSWYYSFNGEDNSDEIILTISTQNDVIQNITYTGGDVNFSFTHNGVGYGPNYGSGMSVTIKRYSNGTIDGTFSGIISTHDSVTTTVSQGQFNNLKFRF